MNKLFIVLFTLFALMFAVPAYAKYEPLSVSNNRYGIHIADPNDVSDTANLVNSSGGDWGYVTLVIQEDDRDHEKWQRVFNIMRERHLIPIVRLATHIDGASWTLPYQGAAEDWARFLDGLNWPIENRYVVIFNEPNHANEWGGKIDPEGYAKILREYTTTLKHVSEDFFILPAGLDVSAASDGKSLDAASYLSRMKAAEPLVFADIDGWTSHSYPNPAFSSHPDRNGRGSLRSYQWELSYLHSLGVTKELPVFITETGWVHSEGVNQDNRLLSPSTVSDYLKIAATTVWNDARIVAVTPFVYSYQGLPFDHFSWKKLNSSEFYPHYETYKQLVKLRGTPKQREKIVLKNHLIPERLVAGSIYVLSREFKNEGQSIITERDNYDVVLKTDPPFLMVHEPLPYVGPGESGILTVHLETPNSLKEYAYELVLKHNGQEIPLERGNVTLVPPPAVTMHIQLGWKKSAASTQATVLVYDHTTLLHKINGVVFKDGRATIENLRNIIPDNSYRIIVLVPYYLPRQTITKLSADMTPITMPRLYPVDFDQDGALTWRDIVRLFSLQPKTVLGLFVGS